jgi:hypothetical protein
VASGRAREAAGAAKEGGLLGFHAVRVSDREQRMLDTLDEALAPPASLCLVHPSSRRSTFASASM